MDIRERADGLHKMGFNCAQSVLCACGKYTGLDDKTALAVSGGFGGGVRCGEICGAISGAVMAVSTCFPYNDCDDLQAKDRIARLTKQVTGEFVNRFACVRCLDLKKAGISCTELIMFGAEIAEEIIKNNTEEK